MYRIFVLFELIVWRAYGSTCISTDFPPFFVVVGINWTESGQKKVNFKNMKKKNFIEF